MIAKRIPKKEGHSSFRHLAAYILDQKHGGQKLAAAWTTNTSLPDDFDLAIIETQATQELNTRSKIDKTYHLVISIADDEMLSVEEFKDIEERACSAIGLAAHHRICAIHKDTDNLHMHIALSKVHPETLNTIEPYYDKLKLQKVCRECEKIYHLQVDVGHEQLPQKSPSEIHRGLESFQSWIKSQARTELLSTINTHGRTWHDMHAIAGKYGLNIRPQGDGLVFSHVDRKLFVKASSVDRSFSKKSLEERFGEFEPATQPADSMMKYQRGAMGLDEKSNALYAIYQVEMTKIRALRKESIRELMEKRSSAIAEIKARYTRRRQQVSLDPLLTRSQKCVIRKSLSAHMKSEIERHYKDMQTEKKAIMEGNVTKSWQKWLHNQAKTGDNNALDALNQRSANRYSGDHSNVCNNEYMSQNAGILSTTQPMRSVEKRRLKGLER